MREKCGRTATGAIASVIVACDKYFCFAGKRKNLCEKCNSKLSRFLPASTAALGRAGGQVRGKGAKKTVPRGISDKEIK